MVGISISIQEEIYDKVRKLGKNESKKTSRVISEILEASLERDTFDKLFKIKEDKNISFSDLIREVISKGLKT